jgi:hypothetical protein
MSQIQTLASREARGGFFSEKFRYILGTPITLARNSFYSHMSSYKNPHLLGAPPYLCWTKINLRPMYRVTSYLFLIYVIYDSWHQVHWIPLIPLCVCSKRGRVSQVDRIGHTVRLSLAARESSSSKNDILPSFWAN